MHEHIPAPTPPIACTACGDSGYLRADVAVGHPFFGKMFPCSCTTAKGLQRRQSHSQHLADLTPDMEAQTFATFNLDYDPEAYAAAWAFAHDADAPPWLYFEGPPGGGKTHLMAAIAHACLEQGETVMFRVVPKLMDWFKAGYDDDDFQQRFDEVCQIPVLLLDDLGSERTTGWTQERLFVLLNDRYAHRRRTVISTNCSLDAFDDRLRSRLSDYALCEAIFTTDKDYRSRPERRQQRRQRPSQFEKEA